MHLCIYFFNALSVHVCPNSHFDSLYRHNFHLSNYFHFVSQFRNMTSKQEKKFTVKDALDMIFEDTAEEKDITNPVEAIYITPPDAAVLTDEDSADEDEDEGGLHNLSRNQLQAESQVIRLIREDDEEQCLDKNKWKWTRGELDVQNTNFPEFMDEDLSNVRPDTIFEQFIDDDIIQFLVEMSNKYAIFQNCPNPEITKEEIKIFIGILIVSGYNVLPGKRFYWDSSNDMGNQLVINSMRRNRFEQILRFFHCTDNNHPDLQDKMWKLRPLISMIKKKLHENFTPEENLSFDESMVKYFGKHNCKQFIRSKPIRFGYKVWCLNTACGYLVDFEIYQGKHGTHNEQYEKSFGKAAAPLVAMLDALPPEKKDLNYHIYCDNLFTSLPLLSHMKRIGYNMTGTIRENRLPKIPLLTAKQNFFKNERGFYESVICKKEEIMIVKWVDNAVVSVATNSHLVEPAKTVGRYSRKLKKQIRVKIPLAISHYNKNMGGTDRMDQNLNAYRISIRNKKWYWPLLSWLIDVCVNNAWIKMKKTHDVPQLEFRRLVAQSYLRTYGTVAKTVGRPRSSDSGKTFSRVIEAIRYDGREHLVRKTPENRKKRCAGYSCNSIIRTMCVKCDVGLCLDCFIPYHVKK